MYNSAAVHRTAALKTLASAYEYRSRSGRTFYGLVLVSTGALKLGKPSAGPRLRNNRESKYKR